MLRIPFVSRRGRDTRTDGPPEGTVLESKIPFWIDQMPRVGWPLVAVAVMVMCAPGEHHLAYLAGWSFRLAWLMPAVMVAYAGIAASVATRRVKGTPGRRTAILGAWVSISLAMAAQPVSHMFVTGHWDSDPAPVWIVWSVSLVPGGVLGHLMHVAASHVVSRRDSVPVPAAEAVPSAVPVPAWATEEKARRAVPVSSPAVLSPADKDKAVSLIAEAFDVPRDILEGPADKVSLRHPARPVSRPVSRPMSLGDKVSMSARALVLVREGHDEDTIKDTLRTEFTGADGVPPKTNSISKAVTRAQDKVSRAS